MSSSVISRGLVFSVIADRQLVELAGGTDAVAARSSARRRSSCLTIAGEHARAALQRGALHVMRHAAHAAHLLAAAGAAGAAMDQVRQRRAVAGRFLGAVAVDEGNAAMEGAGAEHDVAREAVVVGEERSSPASPCRDWRARWRRRGPGTASTSRPGRTPRRRARARASQGSSQRSRIGEMKAPLRVDRRRASGSPRRSAPSRASSAILARTSSRCAMLTSAPMLRRLPRADRRS